MGSLIVIDGLDGSGKATQTSLLYEELWGKGREVKKISFPNYDDPSSALIKMYLGGELAENADGVNAFAASSFYAVDRYASFKRFWENDYRREGSIILADRYVSSNAIHQMVKLPRDLKSWGCPGPTWCSTWIWIPIPPKGCWPGGMTGTKTKKTFMRRIFPTCCGAGKAPCMRQKGRAGS